MSDLSSKQDSKIARREFIGSAATAGLMFIRPELVRGTAANSAVRVGLLGCGGRGSEVASSIARQTTARVVALADLFDDQLQKAKARFEKLASEKGYAAVDASQMFRGPKAFQQIVASKEVDAVVIASPPYFHPEHLEAAVAAGKHIYLEKPVAVDVHGCKRVIRAGEKANGKLSLAVGFQIRHAPPFVEMVRRIHGGALGKIVTGQTYYYAAALERPDWPTAAPAEKRLRNWHFDRVLSGDILVEQGIHVVDINNWVLQGHPLKAAGAGGRKARTDHGDAWDHYNITFFYPDDIHVSFNSTQFSKGWWDVCERYFGTKGTSESHYTGGVKIHGAEPWEADLGGGGQGGQFSATGSFTSALKDADPEKHKAFIASITAGKFIREASTGAESALSAILARTAAYTGKEITWDALLRSDEAWDSKLDLNKLV